MPSGAMSPPPSPPQLHPTPLPHPPACRQVSLASPILLESELAAIAKDEGLGSKSFKCVLCDVCMRGTAGLVRVALFPPFHSLRPRPTGSLEGLKSKVLGGQPFDQGR